MSASESAPTEIGCSDAGHRLLARQRQASTAEPSGPAAMAGAGGPEAMQKKAPPKAGPRVMETTFGSLSSFRPRRLLPHSSHDGTINGANGVPARVSSRQRKCPEAAAATPPDLACQARAAASHGGTHAVAGPACGPAAAAPPARPRPPAKASSARPGTRHLRCRHWRQRQRPGRRRPPGSRRISRRTDQSPSGSIAEQVSR